MKKRMRFVVSRLMPHRQCVQHSAIHRDGSLIHFGTPRLTLYHLGAGQAGLNSREARLARNVVPLVGIVSISDQSEFCRTRTGWVGRLNNDFMR